MKILWIKSVPPGAGSTRARFNLALNNYVRLFGLRLIEKNGKYLVYGPNAGGAGVVTFSPQIAMDIANLAVAEMERVPHDDADRSNRRKPSRAGG